jgi:hypothetical protein
VVDFSRISNITHISDAVQTLKARSSRSYSVLDRPVLLPVNAADVDKAAGSGVVVGDELSGDGELLRGIDRELWARAVVLGPSQSVRVEATSPLIANSIESTLFTLASINAFDAAGVGSESHRF